MFRSIKLLFRRISKSTAHQYERIPSMEDEESWQKICNSKWPSTADPRVLAAISSHRSFYSGSASWLTRCLSDTKELIFAVYIYYDDRVIFSKVLETETVSDPFLSRPLKLSFLGSGETVPIRPLKYDDDTDDCTSMSLAKQHLRVSWIVIDPSSKRAVNIDSHKAVNYLSLCSDRIYLSYATVAAAATGKLVEFSVLITCGRKGREIIVKHVKMEIMDGFQLRGLGGRESMMILQAAMEGSRRRIDTKMEKRNYKKVNP